MIHVTGYKGLVGSALSNEFNPAVFDKRIVDLQEYKDFLISNNVNIIIHAAGKVGGVLNNFNNRIEFYLLNSNLNNLVFQASMECGVKTFVNFSSTCVFPDKAVYPLAEDQIFNGPPHYSNDGYAYAKRMMQYLCRQARENGLNYFTIIPTNCFGENDNFTLEQGHFIPNLIHKCYLAKKYDTDLEVWGTGKPLREFIYSKDLAKITKLLIEKNQKYDSVIVSTSEEKSILECVELVIKLMDFKGNVILNGDKPDGQFRKPTDNSRLKELLPDFKFTDFEVALGESISWFLRNYENVRK